MRASSIAIVLSAGVLKTRPCGPLIDAHDDVVRFNCVSTHGFEAFVGSRTTWMVVHFKEDNGPSPAQRLVRDPTWQNVTALSFEHERDDARLLAAHSPAHPQWSFCNHSAVEDCARVVPYAPPRYCSSGMLAVLWALARYDRVTIFGLPRPEEECGPYHYDGSAAHRDGQRCRNEQHDFLLEHRALRRLHRTGKLRLEHCSEVAK